MRNNWLPLTRASKEKSDELAVRTDGRLWYSLSKIEKMKKTWRELKGKDWRKRDKVAVAIGLKSLEKWERADPV